MELPSDKDADDLDHSDGKIVDGMYVQAENDDENSDTQEGILPGIPGIIDIAPTESPKRLNLSHIQHREDKFDEGYDSDGFDGPYVPPYSEVDAEAEMEENSKDIPTRSEVAPISIQNPTDDNTNDKEDETTLVDDSMGSFVDISDFVTEKNDWAQSA